MTAALVPRAIDVDTDLPLVEIPVPRPQDEARAAVSVVQSLVESGVAKHEIIIVASNLREYEPALARAAIRSGLTPTFWTQLDLENSQLFRLLVGISELLGSNRLITASDLQTVLAMGWTPPDPDEGEWPMSNREVVRAFEGIPSNARKAHTNWQDRFASGEHDDRVLTLLNWLDQSHSPTPPTVESVLNGLVGRYREHLLPRIMSDDVPALLKTETAARATVRMEKLVEQVGAKYRARLNASRISASWPNVAGLIESVGSQAPGRREHQHAEAIDILEPNDVWPRQAQYVIMVGLVEGDWPTETDSLVPAELRNAINAGLEGAETIAPRPSWTAGRAIDQFAEVLDAATEGVLLLRHTRSVTGESVPPSSLLDMIPTSLADGQLRDQLLRETNSDPNAIIDTLGLRNPAGGDVQ